LISEYEGTVLGGTQSLFGNLDASGDYSAFQKYSLSYTIDYNDED